MAMNERGTVRRLACGRSLSQLVDQVAEGALPSDPEHQATCRYCRAALAELEHLWGGVKELSRAEVAAPHRVVQAVMRRVRALPVATGQPLALEDVLPRLLRHAFLHGQRGTTRISDTVVATIAARAAGDVHGVVELDGVTVDVRGAEAAVGLALVILFGANAIDLAHAVRQLVIERIESLAGVAVLEVNVTVRGVAVPE